MSGYEFLTLLVSVGALLVSLASMRWTHKISKEQLEIERVTAQLSTRQLQVLEEEQKAKNMPKFQVTISKLGKSSCFYIVNIGEGSAYDVNFELIDCESSPLVSDYYEKFPHPEMKPQSRVKLLAAFHMQSPLKYQVRLSWKDEFGAQQEESFWITK